MENELYEDRESLEKHRRPRGTPHLQEVNRAPQGFILVRAGSGRRAAVEKALLI